MGLFNRIALAALMTVAPPVAALAADAIAVPLSSSPAGVPVAEGSGFDWAGFYVGVYGAAQGGASWNTQYGLGVDMGVNAELEFLLVGAEVALHGLTGETVDTAYGQVLGRAGLVLTDDVLVYAAAGYGIDFGTPGDDDILLGGGLEFAVTDDFTVRAQYLHGFAITGGTPKEQVTLGANYHF